MPVHPAQYTEDYPGAAGVRSPNSYDPPRRPSGQYYGAFEDQRPRPIGNHGMVYGDRPPAPRRRGSGRPYRQPHMHNLSDFGGAFGDQYPLSPRSGPARPRQFRRRQDSPRLPPIGSDFGSGGGRSVAGGSRTRRSQYDGGPDLDMRGPDFAGSPRQSRRNSRGSHSQAIPVA